MTELETLQAIVADETRSADERKTAAEHILKLQGHTSATPTASGAPTDDFNRCVLWHTWKYGPNGGQGEFNDWRITEGARLTQVHDQRLLARIAELDSMSDGSSHKLSRILRLLLSHKYTVSSETRQHWHSFLIITE